MNAIQPHEQTTSATTSWIEHAPGVCGGDARIRRTRYTVQGLVEWKRLGLSDEQILEHHPDLTLDDLKVAWWYYDTHKDEIEQALREEEEDEALSENGPSLRR